jgi:hypothetical protein
MRRSKNMRDENGTVPLMLMIEELTKLKIKIKMLNIFK